MKRVLKQTVAVMLSAGMVLGLAGCSGFGANGDGTNATDANGNVIGETDANGNVIGATDANGNPVTDGKDGKKKEKKELDPKYAGDTVTIGESTYDVTSFENFCMDVFREEVTSDTISLNYSVANPANYGIEDYEITYGDIDLEKLDDDTEAIEMLEMMEQRFDRDSLDEDEKITYDIMVDLLERGIGVKEGYLYTSDFSPTIGFNCQLPVILAEYSFRRKQDVYDYVELLPQTDAYVDQLLEIEKIKSEKGYFMEDWVVDQILEQAEGFIENPESNYLIEVFNDKVDAMDDLTPEEKTTLKAQNKDAVLNHVVVAYQHIIDVFTELKGTNKYQGGMVNYPGGETYYQSLLQSSTGTKMSAEELDALLDQYIRNAMHDMGTIMREDQTVYDRFDSATYVETDPEKILEDLQVKIQDDFPALPEGVTYTINYVHESLQDHMSPAFYMTPALDDYLNNRIYINPTGISEDVYTTLAHEGFPGHLLQNVYTASTNTVPLRSVFNSSAYSEGWATYVEMMAYEWGLEDDPNLAKFLKVNQEITLYIYAKIELGVNAFGWTQEELSSFISNYFGELDDEVIEEMYYAMVSEPGNYLKYVIGYIEFCELRKEAESTLGDKFDAKAYHEFLLSFGEAPFYILEEYLQEWMSKQ